MDLSDRRQKFFAEQYQFGRDYLASFLGITPDQYRGLHVLEVGGGEFGLLRALSEYGAYCTGIDISESRVNYARTVHGDTPIIFYVGDICNYNSIAAQTAPFDLIVLRDVIEHIPQQAAALNVCAQLLKPGGRLFISFPPIYSPFGGHQQNFKYGVFLPYIHLLPNWLYRLLLKLFGANAHFIDTLIQTKSTGITIRKVYVLIKRLPLQYVFKKCYLIRPDYEIRFRLKRRSFFLLNDLPFIREFFSTGCLIALHKTLNH